MRPLSYVEQIVALLEREIVTGKLAPGQRLLETEIAARVGVSRAPVREALQQLEHDGLVTSAAQRGAHVRPLSAADAWNLYIVRAYLAALAARLATPKCGPAELRKLDDIVGSMNSAARAHDRETFVTLHIEFMTVLTMATGNEWIGRILRLLSKSILRYGTFAFVVPGHFRNSFEGHRRALEAIKAGAGARAESALQALLEESGRRVADYLAAHEQPAAGNGQPSGKPAARRPRPARRRPRTG